MIPGDTTADTLLKLTKTRSDAMRNQRPYDHGEQEELGHRVLYVLAASLALAAIAMIAVALTA
jgi:hypothetical protein